MLFRDPAPRAPLAQFAVCRQQITCRVIFAKNYPLIFVEFCGVMWNVSSQHYRWNAAISKCGGTQIYPSWMTNATTCGANLAIRHLPRRRWKTWRVSEYERRWSQIFGTKTGAGCFKNRRWWCQQVRNIHQVVRLEMKFGRAEAS